MGLCCLRASRGLWGFCVRVELGGLKACGVFASVFILLLLLLSRFLLCLLVLLSSACPLSLWLILGFLSFGVVVSFSLSDGFRHKKKGRKGFAPCVLSSCVVCVLNSCIVIKEFRCCCFGLF